MARIFISYSRNDVDFARKLAASLSELGADVWIDVEDIPVGMNWSRAIQQGLDECEVLLLIMSPESMGSRNVENEWQYVLDQGKPVIPIRWRPAKPHFQLNRLQYHDFHKRDYDQAFRGLHFSLIYQGIDLPAVKSQPNIPASPHSTPFTKVAQSEEGARRFRWRLQWVLSVAGAVALLIGLLLGVNVLRDDDNGESPDPTDGGESIASVIENHSDILTISQIAAGVDILQLSEPVTFFAPSDSYLGEEGREDYFISAFRDDFEYMIELHVVEGLYTLDDLRGMDGETLTTLAGTELTITVSSPSLVLINEFPIVAGDIEASNGTVHIIDGFLWSP